MADDANEVRDITVTNNDQGPRYIHTHRGTEVLRKGDVLATVATGAQVEAIKSQIIAGTDDVPMFTVEGGSSDGGTDDAPAALESLTIAQLRKVAVREEVILTGRKDGDTALPDLTKADEIRAAIEAKRATSGA